MKSDFEVFDAIKELDFEFSGSASQELIEKAEKVIGYAFPIEYREFLSRFGRGDVEGLDIYGLIGPDFYNASAPDAIWVTLDQRRHGLEEEFLVISEDGYGSLYLLCLADREDYKLGAVYEAPIASQKYYLINESFTDFIRDFVNEIMP